MFRMRFHYNRVGQSVQGATSAAEVLQRGGLDFAVSKVPAAALLGDGRAVQVPGQFATVRGDTQQPLGIVGSRYQVCQNREALRFMDAMIGQGVQPELAGTFDKGARCWVLAKLPGTIEPRPGDKLTTHAIVLNSHDGSSTVKIVPTTVRQVCSNGLHVVEGTTSLAISIRHCASLDKQLRLAQTAFASIMARLGTFGAALEALGRVSLRETQVREYVERLFPTKPAAAVVDTGDGASLLDSILAGNDRAEVAAELADNAAKRNRAILEQILDNHASDPARGTAWGAFNAVTEWVDHQMAARGGQEGRLQTLWFGRGAELKAEALQAARNLGR